MRAKTPWAPPWDRPAGSYGGAARPTHGSARAGGPAGGHGTPGGAPARRPGVAQGTCDGTSVLGRHDRRSGDPAARPPGNQPRRHQAAERGPTDPQPPRRPVALRRPKAGWLSPTGYYWIPEAWGHTSSDASGGGPCKHATSVTLAADLTRTWAVAISGTVPDGEEVAASLPPHGGRRSHHPPPAARRSRADHGGSRGRSEGGQPDAPAVAPRQPVRARATRRSPVLVRPSHFAPQ